MTSIYDFGFTIYDFGLQIGDCRLQIADCRLQIADCRFDIHKGKLAKAKTGAKWILSKSGRIQLDANRLFILIMHGRLDAGACCASNKELYRG